MELTDIDGVGPARSDSLVEAGYDSVEVLAMADPEEVADDVGVPDDTALEFVVQAQNMIADDDADESDEEDADADESDDVPDPSDLAEVAEDSDEEEEEDSDEDAEESYELVVDLETDTHYDAYMTALLNAYETRVGSNQHALDAITKALSDARYNSGEVTHELTEYELNTLHASVSQQVTEYKGMNMIGHMDAMRDLLAQVNEVRNEKLF
jgi:predicted RecB family nuclease